MANLINELDPPVPGTEEGQDVRVVHKQIPVTVGPGSTFFEVFIWVVGFIPAAFVTLAKIQIANELVIFLWLAGVLPGVIYLFSKISARNYFQQLEQRIQAKASEIDNYLEQRVVILNNLAPLVNKAIDLDKDVMKSVAAFRGGCGKITEDNRAEISTNLDRTFMSLIPHLEAYPELKAHDAIAEAMRQNSYLQKEITAARTLYNDTVLRWNTDIFIWPVKQIVAARAGYTTRIPFSVSAEVRKKAREVVF